MSTDIPSRSMAERKEIESPWGSALTLFAGSMMMVVGVWHALVGIAALVNDEVYVTTPQYIFKFDLTGWGWIQLRLGIVVAAAGFFVLKGMMWARVVGIVGASLSLIANFAFLPHYPIWSLLIIAFDAAVIWALATTRGDWV